MTGASKALGHKEYHKSIDEMKHADEMVKRELFLEGLPNPQDLCKLRIGETVEEMLRYDLSLEMDAIPDLKVAIAPTPNRCRITSIRRDPFQEILEDEEEHVDLIASGWKTTTRRSCTTAPDPPKNSN